MKSCAWEGILTQKREEPFVTFVTFRPPGVPLSNFKRSSSASRRRKRAPGGPARGYPLPPLPWGKSGSVPEIHRSPTAYRHRSPPKSHRLTFGPPSPQLSRSLNFPMPGGSVDLQRISEASSKPEAAPPKIGPALLHRTPWTPPTAIRASGINIELEDGSQVIDGVGGAAVACLGMGNQKVMDAITSQLGNLTCRFIHVLILFRSDKKERDPIANHPERPCGYATRGRASQDEHD